MCVLLQGGQLLLPQGEGREGEVVEEGVGGGGAEGGSAVCVSSRFWGKSSQLVRDEGTEGCENCDCTRPIRCTHISLEFLYGFKLWERGLWKRLMACLLASLK